MKKLKGWKEGFLSQAGREILLKAIAQAIPSYAMQCFNIPISILNDIEKICRSFFWGQKNNEKKIAWVSWEKLYGSKKLRRAGWVCGILLVSIRQCLQNKRGGC